MRHWTDALVCPKTHQPLRLVGDELVAEDGSAHYPFHDGIASFLSPEERAPWDGYHDKVYSAAPLPPHPYYNQFTKCWRTMLDLGSGTA